jgi:hypothetical protein
MLKDITKGSILSETSFYVVKSVNKDNVTVQDDLGNDINISNEYVEKVLNSADVFTTTEEKTMTQLAELFINNPRVAMTVAFAHKLSPITGVSISSWVAPQY